MFKMHSYKAHEHSFPLVAHKGKVIRNCFMIVYVLQSRIPIHSYVSHHRRLSISDNLNITQYSPLVVIGCCILPVPFVLDVKLFLIFRIFSFKLSIAELFIFI